MACSAGVFFRRMNVLLAKVHVETQKGGRKWGESKEAGLPSFLLSPWHLPLVLQFLLSRVFIHHNKDGSYNSTNINKQLSPSKNVGYHPYKFNSSTLVIMMHYYVLTYRLEL